VKKNFQSFAGSVRRKRDTSKAKVCGLIMVTNDEEQRPMKKVCLSGVCESGFEQAGGCPGLTVTPPGRGVKSRGGSGATKLLTTSIAGDTVGNGDKIRASSGQGSALGGHLEKKT